MKKPQKIRSRSEAGFTLGELMIGLVIIAIIAGILAWNSVYLVRTYKSRQALRDIVGMIDYTRARALRTRKFHRILLTPWAGNPFSDDRGTMIIQQGDAASIADAFGPTNGTPGNIDSTKPGGQALWIVGRLNARKFGDVGITRLHVNNQFAKSNAKPYMWIYFSPTGRICEAAPEVSVGNMTSMSAYTTHTNCYPADFLICVRDSLETAGTLPHRSRYIRLMGSGQTRVGNADLEACTADPNNNPCCGTD